PATPETYTLSLHDALPIWSVQDGTKVLTENLKRLDLNRASGNLELTYIIRLFREFESGLRRFLRAKKLKIPRTATRLIDRVAARDRKSTRLNSSHLGISYA